MILVILMLLLRSIVAPLLLIGTVVLSFAAALGVSALVFDGVFGFPGADPVVPLFGFVFLVALGVDYNIFLMTRVREESVRHGTRAGVLRGLVVTGGVITSAGLVLAATFAALGVLPILFLAQISFIVAFGVLLDTFLVRSLLVPALAYDIGRAIWWPSKLWRAPVREPRLEPVRGVGRRRRDRCDERARRRGTGSPCIAPDATKEGGCRVASAPFVVLGTRGYSVSARRTSSACSAAWRFAEPVAGDAAAVRATTATGRGPSLFVSMMKYGHAPWFSGSSCAHISSAFG